MPKKNKISNFIKYEEQVYLLTENEQNISHDIPFENSYSGSINLTIKAENFIFIRNHYVDGDSYYNDKDGNKISHEFCHHNNQYYIPASSLKGMIRNKLEIFSYAKLKNKTEDKYLKDRISDKSSLHFSNNLDLSEAIFGTTELKGRVFFSHFKAQSDPEPLKEPKKEILMTPEAKENKFGWKSYPILESLQTSKIGNNDEVISEFKPLKKGTEFMGTMKFHNLRDFELGALLSVLSNHNTKNSYHNIGFAKSLGYGKISIDFDRSDKKELIKVFEEEINASLFNGEVEWHKSSYIKEYAKKYNLSVEPFSKKSSLKQRFNQIKNILEKEASIEWGKIKDSNTKEHFELFKRKYPNNYIDDVAIKLQKIQEANNLEKAAEEAWIKIQDSDNKSDYEGYQFKFPNFYIAEIKDKISAINLRESNKLKQELKREKEKAKKEKKRKSMNNNFLSALKKGKKKI